MSSAWVGSEIERIRADLEFVAVRLQNLVFDLVGVDDAAAAKLKLALGLLWQVQSRLEEAVYGR